jgi:ABC-type bacteriocin/lantibiotic exporter with double-glycine peptidase domain
MRMNLRNRRRFLIPEVVQTSAMDCGPASLKCLLEGFRIETSYSHLRDVCQTDVDGASIDSVEQLANQLGLQAEQIMLPPDHILLPQAKAIPAIAIVRNAEGLTHFVVIWQCVGSYVQLMDPAVGRRWVRADHFLRSLYIHTLTIGAAEWRDWAGSPEAVGCLLQQLRSVRIPRDTCRALVRIALADPGWRSLAALFSVARLAESLMGAAISLKTRRRVEVIETLFRGARSQWGEQSVPAHYWPVIATPPNDGGQMQLRLSGAVLVRVINKRETAPASETPTAEDSITSNGKLTAERVADLRSPQVRPGHELLRLIVADGLLAPSMLFKAILLAAAIVVGEAVLFRSLLDIGTNLYLSSHRVAAISILVVILGIALLLTLPIASETLRLGRHLEMRLRIAVLEKFRHLGDGYFRSRLVSDSAERSHSVHALRRLPTLASQLFANTFQLIFTTAGIVWLAPASAALAIVTATFSVALPLFLQPALAERDLRVRNQAGALSRFYLDAMLGLLPIRAHAAERAIRNEHERLLFAWAHAGLGLQRVAVLIDFLQVAGGFGLAIWLLLSNVARPAEIGSLLLLIFWVLNLPALGQAIAIAVRQYPMQRNVTLRLLEPLSAPETERPGAICPATEGIEAQAGLTTRAASVRFEDVGLTISGHPILGQIDLEIESGTHVAVVGQSGAGKSSFVGLLLGWNTPSAGRILVDGNPLEAERLTRLREETAWIDPTVQLWNRSLAENLCYGASFAGIPQLGQAVSGLELRELLETLPNGLQTPLGEGGTLLSGGEGQRIRLGRAMLRRNSRLVIMDEPFGGLDRPRRRRLLLKARQLWQHATLIYVTHDISEVRDFDRVLVLEAGNIVEDGSPRALSRDPGSRFHALRSYEQAVRRKLITGEAWRRLQLKQKQLTETAGRSAILDNRDTDAADAALSASDLDRIGE